MSILLNDPSTMSGDDLYPLIALVALVPLLTLMAAGMYYAWLWLKRTRLRMRERIMPAVNFSDKPKESGVL